MSERGWCSCEGEVGVSGRKREGLGGGRKRKDEMGGTQRGLPRSLGNGAPVGPPLRAFLDGPPPNPGGQWSLSQVILVAKHNNQNRPLDPSDSCGHQPPGIATIPPPSKGRSAVKTLSRPRYLGWGSISSMRFSSSNFPRRCSSFVGEETSSRRVWTLSQAARMLSRWLCGFPTVDGPSTTPPVSSPKTSTW